MIGAIRFHLYDVLSKRTRIILTGFMVLIALIFMALTRFYATQTQQLLDGATWCDDYIFEGLTILKLGTLMLCAFCGIRLWFYAAGDLALVQRIGVIKLTLSKVIAAWLFGMVMMTLFVMMFLTIGSLFGRTFERFSPWSMWWRLSLFTSYYAVLSALLAVTIRHIFSQLAMVFGWFVSDVLIDMGIDATSISTPALLINAFFVNIHINHEWYLTMLMHGGYIVMMMGLWVVVTMIVQAQRDF